MSAIRTPVKPKSAKPTSVKPDQDVAPGARRPRGNTPRLGEILVKAGVVDEDTIDGLLKKQASTGGATGDLVDRAVALYARADPRSAARADGRGRCRSGRSRGSASRGRQPAAAGGGAALPGHPAEARGRAPVGGDARPVQPGRNRRYPLHHRIHADHGGVLRGGGLQALHPGSSGYQQPDRRDHGRGGFF